jgi:hypothetical protein
MRNAVDLVHKLWTSAGHDPWWTGQHGCPWSSLELGLVAALGHGYLPRCGKKKEGATRIQFCLVPRLGRRQGGGALAVELRLRRATTWVQQRGGGDKLMVWECSIGVGGSFYRVGEGRRGGEGGVTTSDAVVFNGQVILGSSRWVKARLEGGK